MAIKHTKWPQNIPNGHKHTKLQENRLNVHNFHCETLENFPKLAIWFENILSGNPANDVNNDYVPE
jgi:hypothetical protein